MNGKTLGAKIRAIRRDLGLNQLEFLAALGHARTTSASEWENNRERPSQRTLERMAELTGKPYEEVFGVVEEERTEEVGSMRQLEPDEEFWIRYDAIEARPDLTNAEKERRIENLSAALRAMAYRWDARSSDSRNRAMREEAVGRGRRDVPPSDHTQVRTYKDLDPLPRATKRVRRRGGEKE